MHLVQNSTKTHFQYFTATFCYVYMYMGFIFKEPNLFFFFSSFFFFFFFFCFFALHLISFSMFLLFLVEQCDHFPSCQIQNDKTDEVFQIV